MPPALIRSAPLDDLNEAQRLAVEHGVGDPQGPAPLLVIAGAGVGKTATLAHRVAHLILSGADPKRIMLATFSRRAAAELNRRVQRLLQRKLAADAAARSVAVLCRHVPFDRRAADPRIRAAARPRSAIHHPRPRGFGRSDESRAPRGRAIANQGALPHQGDVPRHLFARRQFARCARRRRLGKHFPWAAAHEDALRGLFAAYVEMKQRHGVLDYDDLLLYFAQMLAEPDIAADDRRPLRPSAGRRISGHQSPAGGNRAGAAPSGARADGGRRRRAIDLFLPRRDGAQHPRFSAKFRAAGARRHAGAQLPLVTGDPGGGQRSHRAGARTVRQGLCGPSALRARRPPSSPSARKPIRRATSRPKS